MGLNVILPLAGGLAVVAVLVVIVLMKNRTAYLGPVKEELQKEKAWLRRGEYNAAMVKGRQNLELLLKLVAEKNGIQLDNSAKAQADAREKEERRSNGQNRGGRKKTPKVMTHQQFNRWLSDNGYLDRVARWEMNQVRLIGNKAAHENYADKDDAWNQFNYLEDILKTITERSQNPKKRQEQNKKHEQDGADRQKSQGKNRQKQKVKAAPTATQPEAAAAEQEVPKKKKRRKKKKPSNKNVVAVATESAGKNVEKAVEVKQAETPAKPVKQEEKNDAAQAEVKKKSKRRRRRKKPQNADVATTVEKREATVVVQESPKVEVKKAEPKKAVTEPVAEPAKIEPTQAEGEPKPKKRRRRRKKPSGAGAQTTQEVKNVQVEDSGANVKAEEQKKEEATVEKKPNPHKRRRRRRPRKPQEQNSSGE